MSRVLKRPMFRKGGPAMEGVMTGIKDREKFAVKGFTQAQIDELQGGSQAERIRQQAELLGRFAGAPSRQAALTNFLLRFGPAIASRPSTGNIFTDVLGAAQAPAADLAKQVGAEDQFKRQLGLTAASGVLQSDRALRLAALKKAGESGFRKPGDPKEAKQKRIEKILEGEETSLIFQGLGTSAYKYAGVLDDIRQGGIKLNENVTVTNANLGSDFLFTNDDVQEVDGKLKPKLNAGVSFNQGKIYLDIRGGRDNFYLFDKGELILIPRG